MGGGFGAPELLVILIILLPSVANWRLARQKNRSKKDWAALGILFSFISTIVLCALPRLDPERRHLSEAADLQSSVFAFCPRCGQKVPSES